MIEVYPHLWVGDEMDYRRLENGDQWGWYVVQACKEPFHREALGYTGRAAPKDHPEYLYARRGTRLILNIVDTDDPNYFPDEMIDEALFFLDDVLIEKQEGQILVHCNQGESRAPTLALLWLGSRIWDPYVVSFEEAEERFRQLYPAYNPRYGIREYVRMNWDH